MTLVIREANVADAKLIADISHQTFYDTFAAYNSNEDMEKFLNQQFTKGKLILEVGAKGNIFLLAYDKDVVAGYVKLRDERIPPGMGNVTALEVARLYAMTHQIGKGVGSLLMQSSIDIARQKNKEWLWLGVWEKNQRAIDFYAKWGFEKFEETDFLLGDDMQRDWLMKRKV
ncbi:MAG TPA: GNAT family N-acetyltransferase [Flavisolibacter sp.]|jgi:ribosomal protein S18 acetylase RimI-like enzyme|nr:GNAT family N-acetyltransferase [Flavisolibacter sp.]